MPHKELVDAIRRVHAGKKSTPPLIAIHLAEHLSDEALTQREIEIPRCVAEGNRNREIADRLRFVVRGAIQESKGKPRFSLEMADTRLQRTCFTTKCDFDADRLSDLEDETAGQIAGALNRTLILPPVY